MHNCDQGFRFDEIKKQINVVKVDLDEHRTAQQKQDKERELNRERQRESSDLMNKKLDEISTQIKSLSELNTEYVDFKIAWKVGKRIGLGLTVFIASVSVVFGAVYAVREWIRKD